MDGVGIVDACEEDVDGGAPDLLEFLVDRGERRPELGRLGHVVETHDADPGGNRDTCFVEGAEHSERHLVVGGEDGGDGGIPAETASRVVSGPRAPIATLERTPGPTGSENVSEPLASAW